MSFGPCFPDFTPDTTFSLASPYPRSRLVPSRRRSNSLSRMPSNSPSLARTGVFPTTPASGSRSRSPAARPRGRDQNESDFDIVRRNEQRMSRSPEDRSVLMGRRQESTALGLRRVLAGMRPWGTDMTRADDDLNDQESRLIQMDEGIRTFGRGFLLPPGCRQTIDEHEQQQASLSPSEQPSQGQLQEDQDAAGLNNNDTIITADDDPEQGGEDGVSAGDGGTAGNGGNGATRTGAGAGARTQEVDLDADMEDMDMTGVTGEGNTTGA